MAGKTAEKRRSKVNKIKLDTGGKIKSNIYVYNAGV